MKSKKRLFPTCLWEEVQHENTNVYSLLESFQEYQRNTRSQLSLSAIEGLDKAFKDEFEKLESFFWRSKIHNLFDIASEVFNSLRELVKIGASAELLDKNELGNFNVAKAIKSLPDFTQQQDLDLANEIIWLTVQAGSLLLEQKAYAGNGGSSAIYWLIDNMHITTEHPLQQQIHEYSYQMICLMFVSNIGIPVAECDILLSILLRNNNVQLDEHKKIAMRIVNIITGFYCFSLSAILIDVVKCKNWEMIPILLPDTSHMKNAVQIIKASILEKDIVDIINAFTLSKSGRNIFKTQFSYHWLSSLVVKNYPNVLFQLVKRREKTILETFSKKHRLQLVNLKDKEGNTLLHIATQTHGKMENTIKMLLNVGANSAVKNNKGFTPYDIAQKNKNSKLKMLFVKK
ncbi:hypothetical protein [Candidatus Uabimicrobium sp. HlEnr_7]|uniref:hypothetical protein n=1 Tax=Candidatus Uabimicrobium helgolandensis TaxID=3095367 RepID=UPI00355775BF